MIGHEVVAAIASAELAIIVVLIAAYLVLGLLARRDGELPRAAAVQAVLLAVEGARDAPPELLRLGERDRMRVILRASAAVSGRTLHALRRIAGDIGLIGAAEKAARSRWWWRRIEAARLCACIGAGEPFIRPLLRDPSVAVRAQAVEWALFDPSPPTIETLLRLIDDPAALCRFTARDTLIQMGRRIAVPLAAYLDVRHGADAVAGLAVAAAIGDAALLPPLIRLAGDPEDRCRAAALAGLGAIGGTVAIRAIDAGLADDSDLVRGAASRAAAMLGHWQSAPALALLLRDLSFDVRRDAGLALRSFGAIGQLYLRRAIDDPDRYAADMARQLLDTPVAG